MKTIAIIPVYDELGKIGQVLSQFPDETVNEICLVIDSPTKSILSEISRSSQALKTPVTVIDNPIRKGMAHALKQGFRYALNLSYDIVVVLAGNDKDNPQEIPRLLQPIIRDGYDYVQGSRFLLGGEHKTPFLRLVLIRLYALFWRLLTRYPCTDVTNGFRAYRVSILRDADTNVWDNCLNGYAVEFHLHFKVLTLKVPNSNERKYRVREVPVSKVYRQLKGRYSKISPIKDFWSIAGTPIMLKLGIRK